jgi:hypothetical protein
MDSENLSEKIQKELEEITQRKGHLLESSKSGDRTSLEIIDEFLRCNKNKMSINKNLLTALLLISNHLVNESVKQIFRELKVEPENRMVLQLYLYLQMSNNYLDGFLLGHSFLKIISEIDVLDKKDLDILEIFKRLYLIRMKHHESTMVQMIDEKTGLIGHFEKAYNDLFLSNSALLQELAKDNIHTVIKFLMLTFFDGILTAKVISEDPRKEK